MPTASLDLQLTSPPPPVPALPWSINPISTPMDRPNLALAKPAAKLAQRELRVQNANPSA